LSGETTRFHGLSRRKSQPGSDQLLPENERRNLISIYNFSALHFTIASSITVLAVSIGHPAIFCRSLS
jgi:hypothetical protein